ncbi:MAG: potassium transporter [Desulfobacteraceae bacterium]|nr:potassium transporter [Desulfobacteraceae bacterium]
METIWIIGAGRFGLKALDQLSRQHKDWQFVLVDKKLEALEKLKEANISIEQTDGARFLLDHLKPGTNVSWIIPSLPLHLAWEWCRMKMGTDRIEQIQVSSKIDSFLPHPIHGTNKDIYVSNADFICPSNCNEPEEFCTVTKGPRKKDMFRRLKELQFKDYTSIVLRSKQIGAGIGGYTPDSLFSFLEKVAAHTGLLLLCTACRCHGVITGVKRL